jgi:hypothetical protein
VALRARLQLKKTKKCFQFRYLTMSRKRGLRGKIKKLRNRRKPHRKILRRKP